MIDELQQPQAGQDPEAADLIETIAARLQAAKSHQEGWRTDARDDYAYVAGDQWTESDKQRLRDQLRPVITFNRIAPIIDSVAGTEVTNRQEVRYIPRQAGDVGVNELLTGAALWVRDQCDAEDEESDAFWDTLVCGMGWTETRLSYEQDPDGMILVERVDPLEMYWDPAARKRNLDDARWLIRVRTIGEDEFKRMWPDAAEMLGAPSTGGEPDGGHRKPRVVNPRLFYDSDDDRPEGMAEQGGYIVTEFQRKESVPFWRAVDPATGQIAEFADDQWKVISARLKKLGIPAPQAVRQHRIRVKRAFMCGGMLLEDADAPDPKAFTYQPITGKRDRNKGVWYGLVRSMKDPQQWANKWLSQTLHIMNSTAKGGVMATKDAVPNVRRFEEDWAKPEAVTWVTDPAKIIPKPTGQFPQGTVNLTEFAIGSIRDVSGVNLEMLGLANRDQPGVLEYQRKQAALVVLGTLFDSLRRYRKQQGRVLLHMISTYISDGRLIKVATEGTERYVPLVHKPDTLTYDVIVDDAPNSPNQKERTWQIMQGFLPMLQKMPIPPQIWAEVLRASPLPSSFTDKVIQYMQQAAQQPPKPDPRVQQAQAELQMRGQKAQAETQIKAATAQADMRREDALAQHDMEMSRAKAVGDFLAAMAQPAPAGPALVN